MTFDELCERFDELGISGDTAVLIQDEDGENYSVTDVVHDPRGVAAIIIEFEEA